MRIRRINQDVSRGATWAVRLMLICGVVSFVVTGIDVGITHNWISATFGTIACISCASYFIRNRPRYQISCHKCGTPIGTANDPREAHDIVTAAIADHEPAVIARGFVNRARFNRANRDR